jgi:acyl-CoA thioesterase
MHTFDRGIAVTRQDQGAYRGTVSADWSINENPNGGYLMALCARAALAESQKPSLSIFTTAFLSRCAPGEAEIQVTPLGASARFERCRVDLFQEGELRTSTLGTFTDRGSRSGGSRLEAGPPDLAPAEACVPIPEMPGYTLFRHLDVRLDPACAGWMSGEPAERSEIQGWVRFRDDRPPDEGTVLLFADAFPPAVLASHGMVAWVPTLECSVNLRQIPESPWLKGRFRSRFLHQGMVEEDGELWDETGALIALSRQIAQFRKGG